MEGQKEGFSNNLDNVNRSEVFRVKKIIKDNRLLNMGHDDDLPVLHEEERDLVRSFGLQGVETVDDLFNRTKAPGYNPEIAKEKLNILATAVYESMVEDGREEIVIAGSESIQKSLSIMWIGKDRSNENSPSFAFMVAENFTNNFEVGDKRNNVVALLENIDFVKKNPEISDSGELKRRAEIALKFLEDPEKFKTNIFNKKEQIALVKTEKYLHKIINSSSQKESSSKDGSFEAKKIAQAAEKMSMAAEKMAQAAGKQTERPKFSKEKNENDDEYVDSRSRLKKLDWENPIEILKYSKDLLDTLENSFYKSNDISMGDTTRNLNIVLDQMRLRMENENGSIFKDIYKEVDSRLALHDSEFYMEDSGFKISDRGGGIGGAVDNIYREKRELNKDRLKFLLRDAGSEKIGLPIDKAWDKIQEANFDYKNLLIKVANDLGYQEGSADREKLINIKKVSEPYGKGTTVENRDIGYWLDNNDERKAKVDAYIIKEISILKSNGEKMDGKKAYQLAKKMVGATGERSVFNFGLVNGDDFAEDIHFGYFRADDARKGKNVGPLSTMGIKTLTPGWLRSMSGKDINNKILSTEIDFDNNEGKSTFGYYYTQILPAKIHALRSVLLDNSPDPKKMLASGAGYFNGIVDAFNKVEPSFDLIKIPNEGYLSIKTVKENGIKRFFVKNKDGTEREGLRVVENKSIEGFDVMTNDGRLIGKTEKSREGENNLRSMYALGLLELIATKPSLGWTAENIMELRKFMVETKLSTAKSFLNEGMWDWINNQVVANDNNENYTFKQALVYNRRISARKSFWNGFLKGVSGQKK